MPRTAASGLAVAVVDGVDQRVAAALGAADGLAARTCEGVEAVIDAAVSGAVDAAVVGGADRYASVRAGDATLPLVVVSDDPERGTVETVLRDASADFLDPGPALETTLPVRLRRIVDGAGSGAAGASEFVTRTVVEFDLETRALLDADDAFFERWRWDRGDLADATLSDLFETDITHELRGQSRAGVEESPGWIHDESDPVDALLEHGVGGRFDEREWHCRDAAGRRFKATVEIETGGADDRGRLVATVPTPVDDRSLAFDEASMLRSLVEHVPMSVYFKDGDGRHVLVSEDVVEPFIESPEGKIMHVPEDVHGKTDFDLYPADLAEEAVADDSGIMETGEPIRDHVEEVHPPHGRPLFFQTTKAPWYDDEGRVRGIVGVTVDITDQKRRERELDRQNERLEEFASIVSHDLRNPLNVAKGRLDRYRTTGDEDELERVAAMHDRMEALIEDVLAYAREGDRVEDPEWFDPSAFAADVWDAVDTGGATLELAWTHRIAADSGRLARALENLFRNAVEHGSTSHADPDGSADAVEHGSTSPGSQARQDAGRASSSEPSVADAPEDAVEHGGESVTVRVGTLADEPGFYVEDDGPGIPEDERDEVFDRGVTSDPDGTGFGLAIVREIAEAHGWVVSLTESESGGARFEFTGVPQGDPIEDRD